MLRIVLVHSGPVILRELDQKLGAYAQRKLMDRKVEVRLKTKVEGFSGGEVRLSDGTTIRTNTLVWTAGTSANPLLESIPWAKERGRPLVTESLEVRDLPGVWALGDCSAALDLRTGGFYPPTAPHALPQSKIVCPNIAASIPWREKKPAPLFASAPLLSLHPL